MGAPFGVGVTESGRGIHRTAPSLPALTPQSRATLYYLDEILASRGGCAAVTIGRWRGERTRQSPKIREAKYRDMRRIPDDGEKFVDVNDRPMRFLT